MEEELGLAQPMAGCFPSMGLPLPHPLSFPSPHGIPPQLQAVVKSCGHVESAQRCVPVEEATSRNLNVCVQFLVLLLHCCFLSMCHLQIL